MVRIVQYLYGMGNAAHYMPFLPEVYIGKQLPEACAICCIISHQYYEMKSTLITSM